MLCRLMNRRVRDTMDNCPCTHSGHHEDQKPYTDRDNDMSRPGMDPSLEGKHSTHQLSKEMKAVLSELGAGETILA